jgi:hypothetical protein
LTSASRKFVNIFHFHTWPRYMRFPLVSTDWLFEIYFLKRWSVLHPEIKLQWIQSHWMPDKSK